MLEDIHHDDAELPSEGDVIDGRYRIESVYAKGGMGTVFRATHLQLQRPVALKVASARIVQLPDGSDRFLREARMATQLQSDHIAQVYDVGVLANGMPYLVMEWLAGSDLGAVLKRTGALSVESAVDCILQACEALAEVHGHGIVHRDLKPSNLFLVQAPDGTARIKLIDFGVSKLPDSGLPTITQKGTVLGSPSYMSPEQMGIGVPADERTDVWALGVVLFELLTCALPFRGETLNDILATILLQPPARASAYEPNVPESLDLVIARCLDPEPAGRFPDVASLAAALAPFGPRRARERSVTIADMQRTSKSRSVAEHDTSAMESGETVAEMLESRTLGPRSRRVSSDGSALRAVNRDAITRSAPSRAQPVVRRRTALTALTLFAAVVGIPALFVRLTPSRTAPNVARADELQAPLVGTATITSGAAARPFDAGVSATAGSRRADAGTATLAP